MITRYRTLSREAIKRASTLVAVGIFLLGHTLTPYAGPILPVQSGDRHARHQHAPASAGQPGVGESRMAIPDSEVYDQDGKKIHFYSELIKGKVVVINFIFTSCTYICPMQGASFARLQNALGERLGKEVYLISISTDPVTDTPERLKAWAKRFGAKAGWVLVTGDKAKMDQILRVMTGDESGQTEHSPIMMLGNDEKGLWVRAYGLADPDRVLHSLDKLRADGQVTSR